MIRSIKRIYRSALFQKTACIAVALCGLFVAAAPRSALAIPAYSRLYNTECTTCHTIYPQRNEFGVAFEKNGLVWPGEGKKAPMAAGEKTVEEKKANELYSLTGLTKMVPISLSLRQAYNVNNRDQTHVVYQSPSAEVYASGPLYGDQFSFWANFPINGSSTTLSEMYLTARRPLDLPVNVRIGKLAPDVGLKKGNDRLGSGAAGAGNLTLNGFSPTATNSGVEVSSIVADRLSVNAGYIDRTATSTLTTFHYDAIGTVSAGTGSVIYSNKKTYDTATQDIKEYYGHVMYKFGGTDYRGKEPDLDLSKESIMDFLSLTVSVFVYDGKTLDTISGQPHSLTREGLEAMVEYKRVAVVFGQQQGVNKETGVDVKTHGNVADITYNFGEKLAAVLRYQYTYVDGGKKIKDVYPAIVFAPRQTVKFQAYCDANDTRNADGTKATKTTTNVLAQVLF